MVYECRCVLITTNAVLPMGKVSVIVMLFCVCLTLYRVHRSVGRRLGLFCLTSSQLLTGPTIRVTLKQCSVGIGRSVLSFLTQFLSNRSQYVVLDGCQNNLVNVVSGVPRESIWSPLFFILYNRKLFSILENKQYGFADALTLVAGLPSQFDRLAVQSPWIVILIELKWCESCVVNLLQKLSSSNLIWQ